MSSAPDIDPQVAARELEEQHRRLLRMIDALPHEEPRIGSFATGMANVEPRPWNGKQMVGDRG